MKKATTTNSKFLPKVGDKVQIISKSVGIPVEKFMKTTVGQKYLQQCYLTVGEIKEDGTYVTQEVGSNGVGMKFAHGDIFVVTDKEVEVVSSLLNEIEELENTIVKRLKGCSCGGKCENKPKKAVVAVDGKADANKVKEALKQVEIIVPDLTFEQALEVACVTNGFAVVKLVKGDTDRRVFKIDEDYFVKMGGNTIEQVIANECRTNYGVQIVALKDKDGIVLWEAPKPFIRYGIDWTKVPSGTWVHFTYKNGEQVMRQFDKMEAEFGELIFKSDLFEKNVINHSFLLYNGDNENVKMDVVDIFKANGRYK